MRNTTLIFLNIFILVDILMNKEPDRISNALNFLKKMLEECENKKDRKYEGNKSRKIFGEMFGLKGRDKDNIFYLIKCPELNGKTLLSYINSQNVRLFRQGEELSVMIANMKN